MNSEIEKKLWQRVDKYIGRLNMVPFVRMVAVCNNLAFGKIDGKSDIDLFVIAEKGRLFIVRSFVTFLLHIWGVRRYDKKIAGRFCLSFFIDTEAMDLSKVAIRDDIYLAYWVRTMIPVIDDGISIDFLKENIWAKRFFEDGIDFSFNKNEVGNTFLRRKSRAIFGWILNKRFGDFLERRLKSWQLKRARRKMDSSEAGASLIVDDHILKFHNIDRRSDYRRVWFDKYGDGAKITEERFLSL